MFCALILDTYMCVRFVCVIIYCATAKILSLHTRTLNLFLCVLAQSLAWNSTVPINVFLMARLYLQTIGALKKLQIVRPFWRHAPPIMPSAMVSSSNRLYACFPMYASSKRTPLLFWQPVLQVFGGAIHTYLVKMDSFWNVFIVRVGSM